MALLALNNRISSSARLLKKMKIRSIKFGYSEKWISYGQDAQYAAVDPNEFLELLIEL